MSRGLDIDHKDENGENIGNMKCKEEQDTCTNKIFLNFLNGYFKQT